MTPQEQITKRERNHQSLTHTIVEAVADAKHVNPLDLTPCLYEVIDPNALESLFETPHCAPASVRFTIDDVEVQVRAGETVNVMPAGASPPR